MTPTCTGPTPRARASAARRSPTSGGAPADPNWVQLGAGKKPCGVAVDSGHVYWGEYVFSSNGGVETAGTNVGRVSKDGSGKNESFISGVARVTGVAVDDKYVYTANQGTTGLNGQGSIGRASIDGGSSGALVGNLSQPWGVAVEASGPTGGNPALPVYHPPIQLPPQYCTGCTAPSRPVSTKGDPPADMNKAWGTNKVFVPARWNTPLIQVRGAQKRKLPQGTVFNYVSSRAGRVQIVINGVGKGRKSGKKCVRPTKRNARKRSCVRLTKIWTLTRQAKLGANSVAFSGRVKGKVLKPGAYQASFTGVSGKQQGRSRVVAFRVARP